MRTTLDVEHAYEEDIISLVLSSVNNFETALKSNEIMIHFSVYYCLI